MIDRFMTFKPKECIAKCVAAALISFYPFTRTSCLFSLSINWMTSQQRICMIFQTIRVQYVIRRTRVRCAREPSAFMIVISKETELLTFIVALYHKFCCIIHQYQVSFTSIRLTALSVSVNVIGVDHSLHLISLRQFVPQTYRT